MPSQVYPDAHRGIPGRKKMLTYKFGDVLILRGSTVHAGAGATKGTHSVPRLFYYKPKNNERPPLNYFFHYGVLLFSK